MNRTAREVAKYYPALRSLAAGGLPGTVVSSRISSAEIERFGGALKNLQRGLTGDRLLAGASYFSSADYLGAYLLYYWPVSFVQVSLALEELRLRGALPRIRKVLDIGAGPGPASFAVAGFGAAGVGASGSSALRCTLIDANGEALKAAMRLGKNAGIELVTITRNLEDDSMDGGVGGLGDDGEQGGAYDLIVACHSANELWKGRDDAIARRARLCTEASGRLAEGGILLIVEPSANVTGRPALELRDCLLAENPELSCVAPCPGSFPCPIAAAGEGRSCHSTWAWEPDGPVAALAQAAGLDRDSVKATWFALRKGASPGLLAKVEATQREGRLSGRVVSEPMLNKAGRVRYILCSGSGLATISAKGGDGAATSEGFFSLGRGDLVEAEGLERRAGDNSFGFMPGSRLTITLKAPEA